MSNSWRLYMFHHIYYSLKLIIAMMKKRKRLFYIKNSLGCLSDDNSIFFTATFAFCRQWWYSFWSYLCAACAYKGFIQISSRKVHFPASNRAITISFIHENLLWMCDTLKIKPPVRCEKTASEGGCTNTATALLTG